MSRANNRLAASPVDHDSCPLVVAEEDYVGWFAPDFNDAEKPERFMIRFPADKTIVSAAWHCMPQETKEPAYIRDGLLSAWMFRNHCGKKRYVVLRSGRPLSGRLNPAYRLHSSTTFSFASKP